MALGVLKTIPEIDIVLRRRVELARRRGRKFRPFLPPLLHPKSIEREYFRDLMRSFTKMFQSINDELVTRLPALLADGAAELGLQRVDAFDDELSIILDGILVEFGRKLTQDDIKRLAKSKGISVSEFNRRQNKKVFKQVLGLDILIPDFGVDTALENFASENASLITTLSQKHVKEVRGIVVKAVRQGTTAAEVAKQIAKRTGTTRANVKLIARDQISKLNGQLTHLRQTSLGITRYIWRTARDERVRPTHRAHGAQTEPFDWDDPPADTGHPGEDFQCRCYPEPVLEDLIE